MSSDDYSPVRFVLAHVVVPGRGLAVRTTDVENKEFFHK